MRTKHFRALSLLETFYILLRKESSPEIKKKHANKKNYVKSRIQDNINEKYFNFNTNYLSYKKKLFLLKTETYKEKI